MKLITHEHKVCDYTCMWNGIQDIYQQKSGEDVPGYLFFCLSGIGNFVYLSFKQGGLRKMVGWGDGRPKKMYPDVCGTIGFSFKCIEGTSFAYCLKTAKAQIDEGKPVVLGCLDMYYLDYYPKMYQKIHMPIHYVLMVGYDDDKQCVCVLDCGKPDMQTLSYACLEQALNVKKSPVGDKNGLFTIDFAEPVKPLRDIAVSGFLKKAQHMLNPPVGFAGIRGMRKLAREIDGWREELTPKEYREALENFVMFTGTVPNPPARLFGCQEDDIRHDGARAKMSELFAALSGRLGISEWHQTAALFSQSGDVLVEMTDLIVDDLLGQSRDLGELSKLISRVADLEEKAYIHMLRGAEAAR